MTKEITVADLKEHLDDLLKEALQGTTLRIVDGGVALLDIVPAFEGFEDLTIRPARGSLRDFVPPPPLDIDVDVVALLREDRDAR
jgi:antitoxin (DNA-binding transcriptional repressor) of toxin-antitoxin stability system